MPELNALAIEAKHNEDAFQTLLKQMEPLCRAVSIRYESWLADREEILQWSRIEVWNAVKKFQTGKKSFYSFCKLTLVNHIKSKMYRLYGKGNLFNRTALRLDAPVRFGEAMEDEDTYIDGIIRKSVPTPYEIVLQKKYRQDLYSVLHKEKLTPLEYNCMVLFYFKEYSHKDIQRILKLKNRKTVDNALARVRNKLSRNKELYEIFKTIKTAI